MDDRPSRPDDPLTLMARQDLDRFSVSELEERIGLLEAELQRVRNTISRAVNHKASAEALFRK